MYIISLVYSLNVNMLYICNTNIQFNINIIVLVFSKKYNFIIAIYVHCFSNFKF